MYQYTMYFSRRRRRKGSWGVAVFSSSRECWSAPHPHSKVGYKNMPALSCRSNNAVALSSERFQAISISPRSGTSDLASPMSRNNPNMIAAVVQILKRVGREWMNKVMSIMEVGALQNKTQSQFFGLIVLDERAFKMRFSWFTPAPRLLLFATKRSHNTHPLVRYSGMFQCRSIGNKLVVLVFVLKLLVICLLFRFCEHEISKAALTSDSRNATFAI